MLTDEEFREQNERRVELIRRKHRGGLTEAQERELDTLEEVTDEYIEVKYPLPTALLVKAEQALDKALSSFTER